MKSLKIILVSALIAFCYLSPSHSLKCYSCSTKDSCKKPQIYECNQALANTTRVHLQQYHTGVHPNATSNKYECFKEYIQTTSAEIYYKGCTYANISGCHLPLSSSISASLKTKPECYQCAGRDGCNPAGHLSTDVFTMFTALIVAVTLRYVPTN